MDWKEINTNINEIGSWGRLIKNSRQIKIERQMDRVYFLAIASHVLTMVYFFIGKFSNNIDKNDILSWFVAAVFWLCVGLFCDGIILCFSRTTNNSPNRT